jgi:hypothetical protein
MPGLVKIGMVSVQDVQLRLSQLYSTGVPVPFDLVFACRVPEGRRVEEALHRAFAPNRINPRREFFRIEVEQALAIMRLLHVEEVTSEVGVAMEAATPPEERDARDTLERRRRPNLNFFEMGLGVGSVLISEDTGEQALVAGPRKVIFRGSETSLTEATRQVRGLPAGYSIQPTPFWSHGDTNLSDLYERTYGDARAGGRPEEEG